MAHFPNVYNMNRVVQFAEHVHDKNEHHAKFLRKNVTHFTKFIAVYVFILQMDDKLAKSPLWNMWI